jgi:hypothetical protein
VGCLHRAREIADRQDVLAFDRLRVYTAILFAHSTKNDPDSTGSAARK